ncbi:hypothetical protein OPKNFCMD_0794 [Methylobacterium crusticola]|uniref:Uncharacterized protein n=1 Tax=Methylobacterium crusticola TaxID=1697972 RepID=A0ABQ4QS00_9HYPH|nr:hypothetical protein [Methylobacterium crusticola]GJD48078.1 hypothetical protein OPKNFCMD_0794 [Methylobacterium crusticola]
MAGRWHETPRGWKPRARPRGAGRRVPRGRPPRILHVADIVDAYVPCTQAPANDDRDFGVPIRLPERAAARPFRPSGNLRLVQAPPPAAGSAAPSAAGGAG